MAVKRSMSIKSAPIYQDGVDFPQRPPSDDLRWMSSGWCGPWGYKVTRVTNSTEIRPGFLLTKDTVDELINDHGWTVSVLSKV